MSESEVTSQNLFTKNFIEAVIRVGLLLLLATWCFKIIIPFIVPVVWGIIIAVAIYPLFCKLKKVLGERNKLAAIVYTLITLTLLITPTVMISDSIIETSSIISERYEQGTLDIPPPNESVKEWPLVGEKLHTLWSQASIDLENTLKKYESETRKVAKAILSGAAGAAGTILQFVLSIIISGVLVANASGSYNLTLKVFTRLTNVTSGKVFANLTRDTIRSVAQGVLGVALIQAAFSALGMMVMDVPAWGLWTLVVLVLAIAQ
ncbi:MAG: AI-2E family transporter, partial [Gammaproteobacteria bacterium]|nr:AI-2E family transporter [Gammaproteobacteria bacterium]